MKCNSKTNFALSFHKLYGILCFEKCVLPVRKINKSIALNQSNAQTNFVVILVKSIFFILEWIRFIQVNILWYLRFKIVSFYFETYFENVQLRVHIFMLQSMCTIGVIEITEYSFKYILCLIGLVVSSLHK